MKKALSILFFLLSISSVSVAQVELKGFQLGQPYEGEEVNMTTVGGIDGAIMVSQINDGRAYMIFFVPSEDGETLRRVYNSDVTRLKNGLEKKYGIKFKRRAKNSYSDDDYYLRATKEGVQYTIIVDSNEYMEPPTEMKLYLVNTELDKINQKEEQQKANSDF
ncbi:hypothetical protein LCM02_09100 [Lutimonas saemankumensis]|uniref:hypothetical protein n=1 Tax=Lutimonas saemankumensis TaxID=483016 RepID=UPI001CD26E28|nr:hypothetical protein [Lutimonas saemankumensis]MCA0932606.1 hypothetical protein [Lutimonas saemankumensis]